MKLKKIKAYIFITFLVLFFIPEARALVSIDQNLDFNFRFNNPGARANAMGGAFIGLADDATAAYANPAGLTILTKPEISIEYKTVEYESTQYGPTGTAYDFDEEGDGLSFVSLALPMENATFTAYRHQLFTISNSYSIAPLQFSTDTDIETATYGIGAGLELLDNLSFGFSVGFSYLSYYYESKIFPNPSLTGFPTIKYHVDDEDTAEHYTFSMLWNPAGDFSIGMVYRKGPEFKTTFETQTDVGNDGLVDFIQTTNNTLKIPDSYGMGISYRFSFGLTIAADVNIVEYSDILEDFVFPSGLTQAGSYSISDYEVDDATEFHLGFEYVLDLGHMPLAIRAGYYYLPEHRITYDGPVVAERNIAQEGEDEHIYSFGIGTVFSENVQIDIATSFGKYEKGGTISFVYRME